MQRIEYVTHVKQVHGTIVSLCSLISEDRHNKEEDRSLVVQQSLILKFSDCHAHNHLKLFFIHCFFADAKNFKDG